MTKLNYYLSVNIHLNISELITDKIDKEKIKIIIKSVSGVLGITDLRINPNTNIVIRIAPSCNGQIDQILSRIEEEYDYWTKQIN